MPPVAGSTGVAAVLTAAGSGSRLGAACPKALVKMGGEPLVRRAARGLLASGVVGTLVVTAPPGMEGEFREALAGLLSEMADAAAPAGSSAYPGGEPAEPRLRVVAGSPVSRQASVALGVAAALEELPGAQVILVHDAARALTPVSVIRRVVEAVEAGFEAVVPALPVTDTVKEVVPLAGAAALKAEAVVGTPDRSRLRAVQTPQGFATATLLAAHELGASRAGDEALAASDDAGLVEAAGGHVVTVAGDPLALKVTTPVDLALAEVLLASQPGSQAE